MKTMTPQSIRPVTLRFGLIEQCFHYGRTVGAELEAVCTFLCYVAYPGPGLLQRWWPGRRIRYAAPGYRSYRG